jgi:hypothetical protein
VTKNTSHKAFKSGEFLLFYREIISKFQRSFVFRKKYLGRAINLNSVEVPQSLL